MEGIVWLDRSRLRIRPSRVEPNRRMVVAISATGKEPDVELDRLANILISLQWGQLRVKEYAVELLQRQGFVVEPSARLTLFLDAPRGTALRGLEAGGRVDRALIVVTWNPCPEYLEDLWDLGPDSLIAGEHFERAMPEAVGRVLLGERYRVTPGPASELTHSERAVLRQVSLGQENTEIASVVGLRTHTVETMLTDVYQKLAVRNRTQAALYYWGVPYAGVADS